MATLYLVPISLIPQWLNNIGVMAAGGQLNLYLTTTTTPATTYTDSTGTVTNANPMTLSSTGRAASASGAPVAFWVPSGTVLDLVVYDSGGNLLQSLKGITALNDPLATSNSLQNLLGNPASSNGSGVGPVAGVDLVANALKSYDVFADVRAANAPTLAAGQTLNIQVQGAQAVNDGYGGDFYWSPSSVATDNNTTVLKPTSVTGAGRWLRLYTPPYGAQTTIASAATVDLGTSGTNIIAISGTTSITSFGASASIARPLYFLTFPGILTLTYNATSLILPGNQNILTAPGDSAVALYLGAGNWQVLSYSKAAVTITGGPVVTLLGTPFAVLNSTTLVNVTGFSIALIPGNYLVQTRALLSGIASGMGYKIAATFSGTLSPSTYAWVNNSANGVSATSATTIGTPVVAAAVSTGPQDFVNYDIYLVVTVAGTLQFQMAQNSATASNLTMAAASALLVTTL